MEDIFQLLIFVAFAVLSFVPQLKKGKKQTDEPADTSGEMLEDVFPEMDFPEVVVVQEPVEQPVMKVGPEPVRREKPKTTHEARPSARRQEPLKQSGKKISLSSKEEARRAFICSEIFNRKY